MSTKYIADLLADYFREQGITQDAIAQRLGVSQQYVSGLLSGKKSFGKKQAQRFSEIWGIQPSWLLTGEGEMLRNTDETPGAVILEQPGELLLVPLLPLSAQGGKLNDFVSSVHDYECERIISPVKGAQLAISVSGDSMAPEYPAGSQVLVKRIDERKFIEWGRAYVIDTANGVVIKYLAPSEKGENYVRCLSLNPEPRYAPFDVSLEDVFGIYRVLICMSTK